MLQFAFWIQITETIDFSIIRSFSGIFAASAADLYSGAFD